MDAIDAATTLARACDGDDEAFRRLVETHSRALFRLAYRLTGNEQDAEDVVQDALIRAYRRLGSFESRAAFATWLYRIAANCAVDHLRSRQGRDARHEVLPEAADAPESPLPGPDRLAASAEIDRHVRAALADMSPLERTAFTLRHFEGRSINEICRTLGVGSSAAKHSVFRAVRKLRAALAPLASKEGSTC